MVDDPRESLFLFVVGEGPINEVFGHTTRKIVWSFMNNVQAFFNTLDPSFLTVYDGVRVVSKDGKRSYILETNPVVITRLIREMENN